MVTWATKVNERADGAELAIVDEAHTIGETDANFVYLREIPAVGAVTVTGPSTYTEETNHATPLVAGKFYVFRGSDRLGGALQFHPTNNGQAILVDYSGTGSPLLAEDWNALAEEKVDRDWSNALTDIPASLIDQTAAYNWTGQHTWAGNPRPATSLAHDFGSALFRWNNIYSGGGDFSGNVTVAGTLAMSNNQSINFGGTARFAGTSTTTNLYSGTELAVQLTGNDASVLGTLTAASLAIGSPAARAWPATFAALDVGGVSSLIHSSTTGVGSLHFTNNAYYDGATWRRIAIGAAAGYQINSAGAHTWYTAANDAAGSPFTWTTALSISNTGVHILTPTADNVYTWNVAAAGGAVKVRAGTDSGAAGLFQVLDDLDAAVFSVNANRFSGGTIINGITGLGATPGGYGESARLTLNMTGYTNGTFFNNNGTAAAVFMRFGNGGNGSLGHIGTSGADFRIGAGVSGGLTFSSANNIGVGTTVIAPWNSSYRAIEFGGGAIMSTVAVGIDRMYMMANAYFDGVYKYKGTNPAVLYEQSVGTHRFAVVAQGAAGTQISWLDALQIQVTGLHQMVRDASGGYNIVLDTLGDYSVQRPVRIGFAHGGYTVVGAEIQGGMHSPAGSTHGFLRFKVNMHPAAAGTLSAYVEISGDRAGALLTRNVLPQADNTYYSGASGERWAQVWAANGTIQVSARKFKNVGERQTPEQGLAAIRSLRIYEGSYKTDPDLRRLFPVLDETPEYLRPNDDGESWVLDNPLYANILATQALDTRQDKMERALRMVLAANPDLAGREEAEAALN